MALRFYNAYLNSFAQEPVNEWREITQEVINSTWENTSTVAMVLGQVSQGSTDYESESLQISSLIDPKTGKDLGDEYRQIIYKNYLENELPPTAVRFKVINVNGVEYYQFITADGEEFSVRSNSKRWLGKYYNFDGAMWLTTNTNTIIGATAFAVLTRCNNVLRWLDDDGVLHSWPCVFKRTLSSTNFDMGSASVPQVNANTVILVQRNTETDTLTYNQRLIFDGVPFQIQQINNHISETYMEIYALETQIQPNDSLTENIANGDTEITQNTNGIKITPEIVKLLQGKTQDFAVHNYVDGEVTNDTFSINIIGPTRDINYLLVITSGNTFSVTNLLQSNIPLQITCTRNGTSESASMMFMLGGEW